MSPEVCEPAGEYLLPLFLKIQSFTFNFPLALGNWILLRDIQLTHVQRSEIQL
jgi:hypothetical protein